MENNVWTQLFAQVVSFLSSLSNSSTRVQKPESPISSSNVQGSDASSLLTSKIIQENLSLLRVKRNPMMQTVDALFGDMDYNGETIGVTMERTAVAIPEGTYRAYKRDSAHFGTKVVGIDVPNRTNIEIHWANLPTQLLGCVAIGGSKDGDALDNSRSAFDRMMTIVPQEFTVVVSSGS